MAVLLTRPEADNQRVAELLYDLHISSLSWPLTRIVNLPGPVEVPAETQALICTSANALRSLAAASPVRDLPVFCVGTRTATLAREAGFTLVRDPAPDANVLIAHLAEAPFTHFFHPSGRDLSTDLAADPRLADKRITRAVTYHADPAGPPESQVAQALSRGTIRVVTLWSARNARIFLSHCARNPDWAFHGTDLAAISQKVADAAQEAGFRRILVAATPDTPAMVSTISAALRQ